MANVTFRHGARHVTYVDVELTDASDTADFLLTSDEHIDNANCERDLLKRHLTMADEWDGIISNGDSMCMMQGKYDPRADRSQLLPQLQGNNYFDAVCEYVATFLQPHAKKLIVLGKGNHETNVLKRQQIDMTERLVGVLNDRTGSNILCGGYSGWVFFRMKYCTQRFTIKLYRHHGAGGGAPMTGGTLDTRRMAAWQPDANIIMLGHNHREYIMPVHRQRVNSHGTISYDEQLHIRVPGYLGGMGDGYEGFANERMFPPTGCGAMKLTIGYDARRINGRQRKQFVYDVSRVK